MAAKEPACANDASNPLHMVSSGPEAARISQDPQLESILNQQSADPRLAWVNRQMYLSLHALDVELRREQRIAACGHPESSSPALEAQAGAGVPPAANAGPEATPATATAPAASQNSVASAAAARSTLIRKASLSATGGGGNGATAPKVTAGSDNDIVARRLRKAAEQETNPTLRAKLWKEYADYKQGLTAR